MSQTPEDVERGSDAAPNQPSHPSQGKLTFGDSSGRLFSIYSKAAKEEDDKMVERWQKDAEGILIFTGLFSAAVAALLAVTVQDLKRSGQDTSAFYLGNIYEVLIDPNVTRTSPSPTADPPPFSPPRNAIWVNLLWFLSLILSLSCALLATSLQQWSRRYIRLTQPARCSPEKRARMRAFFADGVDKMQIHWAVEGLPTLLHISLFLFFGGIVVYLYNINHEIFHYAILCIGLFSIVYGLITLLPLIWKDSPFYAPLSIPAWFLYTSILYIVFKILAFITFKPSGSIDGSNQTWTRLHDLKDRYRGLMLGGVEKVTEEIVLKRSSEIDIRILDWTINALGDEDTLENFFEAIPGFFDSRIVKRPERDFTEEFVQKFRDALDEFLFRTWSSNSVGNVDKLRRLDISMNAMNCIRASEVSSILHDILFEYWDEVPQTVEVGQTLARWCTNENQRTSQYAQSIIALILGRVRDCDDSWVALAIHTYGMSESDLRDNIAHGGDSVLLAILIQVTRLFIRSDFIVSDVVQMVLEMFSKLDISKTLLGQQHDFCTLWNDIVEEATNRRSPKIPLRILRMIRHHYMELHHGTGAAPTAFSPSTHHLNPILNHVGAYPLCGIASHHPDSIFHVLQAVPNSRSVTLSTQTPSGHSPVATSHRSTSRSSTHSGQSSFTNIIIEPPSPSSQTDIPVPATMESALPSRSLHAPFASRGASRALRASTSNSSLSTSPSVDFSNLASHPSSRISPQQISQSISLPSNVPRSYPTRSALLSRFRARGLVNVGNKSFSNAVLQLLVYSPPFRNIFRELDELKRQRGTEDGETGGYVTPLADATVRFLEEFINMEEPRQPPQLGEGRTSGEDEEKGKEKNVVDSFEPTYLYKAMNEKSQLKDLLDGGDQDANEFLDLYLAALDEELLPRIASISDYEPAGHSIASPISRIFRGTFCSTMDALNRPDSVIVEDWRSLQLDIQPDSIQSVQDALVRISSPQSIQVGPSGSSEASQQVLIQDLPPVLVLHFKRFVYDEAAGGIVKIDKPIQFTPELEIPLDIMVPAARESGKPSRYTLYGVLYHHGMAPGARHYSVDVLNPYGDGGDGEAWMHIDNESVSKVRHEDVFRGYEHEWAVDRSAYMLFYLHNSP